MSAEIKNKKGLIRISNSVIAKLAGFATTQCYGVVGMCSQSSKDGIASILKKENMDKGIKVRVEGKSVDLSLFIIVEYGLNISTIGETIRQSVKYSIEKMTGLDVRDVRVNVEGIRVE